MKRSRLSVGMYVALIFISGVVIGVFGQRLYTVNTVDATVRENPSEWRKRYISEMQTRLKLAPDQLAQLNTILDETKVAFHQVREKMRPEMDAIREAQFERIQAMLSDAQKAEHIRMREERDRNMKKDLPPPKPGKGC